MCVEVRKTNALTRQLIDIWSSDLLSVYSKVCSAQIVQKHDNDIQRISIRNDRNSINIASLSIQNHRVSIECRASQFFLGLRAAAEGGRGDHQTMQRNAHLLFGKSDQLGTPNRRNFLRDTIVSSKQGKQELLAPPGP